MSSIVRVRAGEGEARCCNGPVKVLDMQEGKGKDRHPERRLNECG